MGTEDEVFKIPLDQLFYIAKKMGDLVPPGGGHVPGVNAVTHVEGEENNQVLAVQSGGCVKCHSSWHSVKDCKQGSQLWGDQKSRACYNCGKEGHISIDCPSPRDSMSRVVCFACGEKGHISTKCMNSSAVCYACGVKGHVATR